MPNAYARSLVADGVNTAGPVLSRVERGGERDSHESGLGEVGESGRTDDGAWKKSREGEGTQK